MRISICLAGLISCCTLSLTVCAQEWIFSDAMDVTSTNGPGIFHHLESSGRKNIAASADHVAVAWEDNRDGTPRIYLALKNLKASNFQDDIRISGNGEAYEPSIVALKNNRFAVAWEENGKVYARAASPAGLGKIATLASIEASQASLASDVHGDGNRILLVYSKREEKYGRVILQPLQAEGLQLKPPGKSCPIDTTLPVDDQLYPTSVFTGQDILVAWEDRRPGHTIIMASRSSLKTPCQFTAPQRISERPAERLLPYGKGHGVARVALANYGTNGVMAAWADKRHFREGYDIYATNYLAGGEKLFDANSKVQDEFGGLSQQWHPVVAGHTSGKLVVAWDDNREGNADIMLSTKEGNTWSEDLVLPEASGANEQSHPSMVLDPAGNLHIAWIEKNTINGPSWLRYVSGKFE